MEGEVSCGDGGRGKLRDGMEAEFTSLLLSELGQARKLHI